MTRPPRRLPPKKHIVAAAALLIVLFVLGLLYFEHLDVVIQGNNPEPSPSALIGDQWSDERKSETLNNSNATSTATEPTPLETPSLSRLRTTAAYDEPSATATNDTAAGSSSTTAGPHRPPEIEPAPPSLTAGITNAPVIPPGQNRAY